MTTQLAVGKVVLGAFLIPWLNRRAFGRALAIPLVSLVTLTLSWYYASEYLPDISGWLLYFMYGVLFVFFAVTCHRLVLLDATSVALRIYPRHWSAYRSTAQSNGPGLKLFTAGTVVGVIGLLLALLSGPHLGGFWLVWTLLVQVILFALARASVRRWVKH